VKPSSFDAKKISYVWEISILVDSSTMGFDAGDAPSPFYSAFSLACQHK